MYVCVGGGKPVRTTRVWAQRRQVVGDGCAFGVELLLPISRPLGMRCQVSHRSLLLGTKTSGCFLQNCVRESRLLMLEGASCFWALGLIAYQEAFLPLTLKQRPYNLETQISQPSFFSKKKGRLGNRWIQAIEEETLTILWNNQSCISFLKIDRQLYMTTKSHTRKRTWKKRAKLNKRTN